MVSFECSWMQSSEVLLRRFIKMSSVQTFSIRELKHLRGIVRAKKKIKLFDFKVISAEFPGKELRTLEKAAKKLLKIRRWPKTYQIIM
jgi:hypothetical protein